MSLTYEEEQLQKLARKIKRYHYSVDALPVGSAVRVIPPFQHPFDVKTWEEFAEACNKGMCALPDGPMEGPDS